MSAQSASSVAAAPSQEDIAKCRESVVNADREIARLRKYYLGIDGLPPPPPPQPTKNIDNI